jgi:hypothetical protein
VEDDDPLVEDAQLRTSEKTSNSVLKPLLCVAGFLLLLMLNYLTEANIKNHQGT